MREAARAMAQKAYRERYFCFSCLFKNYIYIKKIFFKGNFKQRISKLAWKSGKYVVLSLCRLCVVVLSAFMQQKYSVASNLSSSGYRRVCPLFTNGEQKELAHDVMDTCSTHASLVHAVTDAD